MSRPNIDLTQPLSDDDRLYLESRDLQAQLDENALHLMGGGADETAPEEDELPTNTGDVKTPFDASGPNVSGATEEQSTAAAEQPAATAESTEAESAETEEPYKGVTIPELHAEIAKRNEGRAEEALIAPAAPGNRPELVAALVADDEANKTAE